MQKNYSKKQQCKKSKSSQETSETRPRIDPSFKSKRYRDKLRTEIKSLEALLPIDRTSLNRKLDSQTVFRLVLSYFRTKQLFQVHNMLFMNPESIKTHESDFIPDEKHILQILDGFLLMLTSDGTILYATDNVLQYIGFNQVDLLHRCIYGIVHPDDHTDLKTILEQSLQQTSLSDFSIPSPDNEDCNPLAFICRMKYFNGSSAGYLKMHCSGKILHQPDMNGNSRSSNQIVFMFVHPFMFNRVELSGSEGKSNTFWSKHEMDLKIREIDGKCNDVLGIAADELQDTSFYTLIHPEDLSTFASCHKTLTECTDVQTIYFRLQAHGNQWKWFQSRGKVLCKNSKKFSIVFSHCPLNEDDSTYIQQETITRQKYAIGDLRHMLLCRDYKPSWRLFNQTEMPNCENVDEQTSVLSYTQPEDLALSLQSTYCPSSWHMLGDRHSPVLPSNHVAHKIMQHEKQRQFLEFKRGQRKDGASSLNGVAEIDEKSPPFASDYFYVYGGQVTESHHSGLPTVLPRNVRIQSDYTPTVVYIPNHSCDQYGEFFQPVRSFNYNYFQPYQNYCPHTPFPEYYNVTAGNLTPYQHESVSHERLHSFTYNESFAQSYVDGAYSQPLSYTNIERDTLEETSASATMNPPMTHVTQATCPGGQDVICTSEPSEMSLDDIGQMKIVENRPSVVEPTRQVDLPSIGSFLEYLNEV